MNEQEFLCIIRHKEPKVQERIFSILKSNFEVLLETEKELTKNEKIKLFGIEFSTPKKFEEESTSIILLIRGDKQKITKIIGTNSHPCQSPMTSVQYKYGENEADPTTHYWSTNEHIKKVELLFKKNNVHVAGLTH